MYWQIILCTWVTFFLAFILVAIKGPVVDKERYRDLISSTSFLITGIVLAAQTIQAGVPKADLEAVWMVYVFHCSVALARALLALLFLVFGVIGFVAVPRASPILRNGPPEYTETPESALLNLPSELRNKIYRYALVYEKGEIECTKLGYRRNALLATCKQIRNETFGIYYQENCFSVSVRDYKIYNALALMSHFRDPAFKNIRLHLWVVVSFSSGNWNSDKIKATLLRLCCLIMPSCTLDFAD